jgi:hypothetical protein
LRCDEAGDEGRLHLGHGIVDGHAAAFVEDLHAEDLHGAGRANLVRSTEGDIERENLVGVPGFGLLFEAGDLIEADAGEGVDGGVGRDAGVLAGAYQGGVEDGVLREESVLVSTELGTDVVGVGDKGAAKLVDEVQQAMTVEVDPDQAASLWFESGSVIGCLTYR